MGHCAGNQPESNAGEQQHDHHRGADFQTDDEDAATQVNQLAHQRVAQLKPVWWYQSEAFLHGAQKPMVGIYRNKDQHRQYLVKLRKQRDLIA